VGDETQRLWSALVEVYQPVLRDVVGALEREAEIDSGTYSALAYLDREDGAMPLRDLHTLMQVRYSQPGLSRLVQRMESDGLVTRTIDADDRRATLVALTRTGRTRFRRAHEVYAGALDEYLGHAVPPKVAAELSAALEHVAKLREAVD
jgi:DNA-binding MarR family transcriptional regulator